MTATPAPTALETAPATEAAPEFAPLDIGTIKVWPPVVLAPMAGITNAPFRTLCREQSGGKGLYVSEMITTQIGRAHV